MSQSYWDPANLLQVTFNQDDSYGEIQCVGLARSQRNNRCRWTIEDPDRAKIRPLLIQMSKMKPSIITRETLRRLAVLCLCPDYHARQVDEVVTRWAGVVDRAAEHHKNVIGNTPVPAANDHLNLKESLEDARVNLALARADLELQKASAAQFAARTMESTNRLRSEATSWKEQCEKIEGEKAVQARTIVQLQRSLRELEQGLNEARSAATGNADQVQVPGTSWEEKYNKSEAERAEIAAAIASVEEQIKSLEESLQDEKAAAARLAKTHEELQMEANTLAYDFEKSEEERDVLKMLLEDSKEELGAQLGALQIELDETTVQLSASQSETAVAEKRVHELEKSLEANLEKAQFLRGELDEAASRLSTYQEEREQQEAVIAELRESTQAAHREEIESLQMRLDEAYAEQEHHQNTILELEEMSRYLRESNEKSVSEGNNHKEELEVLHKTERELNAALLALQSQRDEVRKHLEDARFDGEELDALRKKEAEADTVRLALQTERDEARKESRELRAKVEHSDKNMVAADEALGKLKLEFAKSEKTAATLTAEVDSRDRALGEAQTELQRERVRVEQLEASVSELKGRRSSASESRTTSSESKAELEVKDRALRQHQSDLENQQLRVAELEKQVADLKASEASLRGSIAGCFLHGVGTAFSRRGKRAREKKAEGIAVSLAAA